MAGRYPQSVSVIIPCYNEGETILKVLEEVFQAIEKLPEVRWEVIVIDDGSTDGVPGKIRDTKKVRVLSHPFNRGYGASLKTGLRASNSEVVVTLDADGQHDPEQIRTLIENMDEYDMTVGIRSSSSGVPRIRRPGKKILNWIMNYFLGEKIPDINSGMRAMRRKTMLTYMHLCSGRFSFSMSSTMILLAEGHLVRFVPVTCRERMGSRSRVNPLTALDALLRMVRIIIVFRPLRVFAPIAALTGSIGLGSFMYDLYHRNIHDITILLLFMAVVFFFFGLLSDQISHIRKELP